MAMPENPSRRPQPVVGEQPEISPQRSPQIEPGVPFPEITPWAPDHPEVAPEPSPDASPPDREQEPEVFPPRRTPAPSPESPAAE